jgi:Asp-tRNA(Asn)/Glu-tRNA(Gln) amidotransferase A subunit family amidase
VEEADPAIDGEAVVPTFRTISAVNTLATLRSHPSGREPAQGEVETVVHNTAELAKGIGGAAFMQAIQTAHRIGRQMAAFHERHDVLLTPALGTLPPKLGWLDMMMDDLDEYWRRVFGFSPFTVWFNLTGQPAMMIPLGRNASGFPIAVQAVARHGEEATLFRLGAQLEAARPWFDRRPPLLAA